MDETINKESLPGDAGEIEGKQSTSAAQDKPTSAVDVDSLKDILEPLVQAEVERRTQSLKDKRIAKQESRISGLEDALAELKALKSEGMSEKQAIQYMQMKEFLNTQGVAGSEAPQANEQPTQSQVVVDDYLSPILQASGLDANDADVVDIIRKQRDPRLQMRAIGELAIARKQAQEKPAKPAQVMPSGGGYAAEGDTLESVTTELNELLAKPVTPEIRNRIRELGKKQRELLPKG